MHVGDLDGSSVSSGPGGKWSATVTITVHDAPPGHTPVANATVRGSWSDGASGSAECVTNASANAPGQCSITKSNIRRNSGSVTFTVNDVTRGAASYDSGANHDPDLDSNGTSIVINGP